MYKHLIFDLDGTLFDTSPGVIRTVQYALDKMGLPVDTPEALRCFIGPPLTEIFAEYCGFSLEDAKRATAFYRERYAVKGVLDVIPYPGMLELLPDLAAAGYTLSVATGKPAVFSAQILAHYGLDRYMPILFTPELDGTRSEKRELIGCILNELGVGPEDYGSVAMIGDRKFDIDGAKEVGVASIGVRYGFAPEGELEAHGADVIVDTVADLRRLLLGDRA